NDPHLYDNGITTVIAEKVCLVNNGVRTPSVTNWLRSAESAQTPREDLINELLDRYSSVSSVLRLFRNFDFTPKKPARALIL
ncbi:MAG: hypothetical protein WCO19_05450, partial [Candidatus Saccharibacteria bacterium]